MTAEWCNLVAHRPHEPKDRFKSCSSDFNESNSRSFAKTALRPTKEVNTIFQEESRQTSTSRDSSDNLYLKFWRTKDNQLYAGIKRGHIMKVELLGTTDNFEVEYRDNYAELILQEVERECQLK